MSMQQQRHVYVCMPAYIPHKASVVEILVDAVSPFYPSCFISQLVGSFDASVATKVYHAGDS